MSYGTLYIVSTPIGNLADITLRALEVFKSCDLILSEDTRETDKVLKRYEITKKQMSYRDQNHLRMQPLIFDLLEQGQNLVLVTDSGTPLISDPGYKLVADAKQKGFNVVSIPGASAVIAALSVSGLPTDKFSFLGFLPKGANQRLDLLKEYGALDSTLVIYESPFRVGKLLEEIKASLGNRKICIVNDITKMYEKVETGFIEEISASYIDKKLKGEFVILIAKENL